MQQRTRRGAIPPTAALWNESFIQDLGWTKSNFITMLNKARNSNKIKAFIQVENAEQGGRVRSDTQEERMTELKKETDRKMRVRTRPKRDSLYDSLGIEKEDKYPGMRISTYNMQINGKTYTISGPSVLLQEPVKGLTKALGNCSDNIECQIYQNIMARLKKPKINKKWEQNRKREFQYEKLIWEDDLRTAAAENLIKYEMKIYWNKKFIKRETKNTELGNYLRTYSIVIEDEEGNIIQKQAGTKENIVYVIKKREENLFQPILKF